MIHGAGRERRCGPPALVAMLPPIVEISCEEGSARRRVRLTRHNATTRTDQASQRVRAFLRVELENAFMRANEDIPACIGTAPPQSPVPARATIGALHSRAILTTAQTSRGLG